MLQVDARGLSCPEPVLRTRAALAAASDDVEVLVDTAAQRDNVRRAGETAGRDVTVSESHGIFTVVLTRR